MRSFPEAAKAFIKEQATLHILDSIKDIREIKLTATMPIKAPSLSLK